MTTQITLQNGPLQLILSPWIGGAIASFTHNAHSVLRPVSDPRLAAQCGHAVAAYPLIPYANRIAFGRMHFGGQVYTLERNFGDHPHPIHGNAWMRAWTTLDHSETEASLALEHTPPADPDSEWPFAYRAEQHFSLGPDSLTITLSVESRDNRPFPAGLGLHPYIAREGTTRLQFDAEAVWSNGPDALPAACEAVAHQWDFSQPRDLNDTQIDECYAGWGGQATVQWPGSGLTLRIETAPPFDHLQLYTPPGRDFFGLEPVSNMPDAVNRMETVADNGMRVLQPGERLEGSIRFVVGKA
jgi:aldose 1-epimerase